jgi:nicotinamidase-related amidase
MKGTSKHLKRKSNRARHNKKVKRGGANWITGANRTDLIHLWNSLFYERAKKNKKLKIEDKMVNERNLYGRKIKALFVIDMQNDFVDRVYDREEKKDVHPIHKTSREIGNFAVSGGATMLNPNGSFITFLNKAIKEYKYIIFSRDYHPVGHNSFNKSDFFEKNLCGGEEPLPDNDTENGNFPAHCVQGSIGSLFVPEVANFIEKNSPNNKINDKIKIVFKGIHKHVDSFTAVPNDVIDHFASNKNKGCNCGGHKNPCSTITGGYILKFDYISTKEEIINYNRVSMPPVYDFHFEKAPYDEWLKDINEIDVCGLAGDYCVRDTIMSLAKKYPKKIVRLLAEHTRYSVLPYRTILTLPQHVSVFETEIIRNNETNKKKNWDVTQQYGLLNEDKIRIKAAEAKETEAAEAKETEAAETKETEAAETKETEAAEAKETEAAVAEEKAEAAAATSIGGGKLEEATKIFLDKAKQLKSDKDITFYMIEYGNSTFRLMNKDELQNITDESIKDKYTKYYHFITPIQNIINDYELLDNIRIYLPKNGECKELYSEKPSSEEPSSKKPSSEEPSSEEPSSEEPSSEEPSSEEPSSEEPSSKKPSSILETDYTKSYYV